MQYTGHPWAFGIRSLRITVPDTATGTPSQAVVPVHDDSTDRWTVCELWWVLTFRDREQQGRCDRAPMDGFTACPWV